MGSPIAEPGWELLMIGRTPLNVSKTQEGEGADGGVIGECHRVGNVLGRKQNTISFFSQTYIHCVS